MLFREERFGMFIHFGLYAVGGWHEQEQMRRRLSREEYRRYMEGFRPQPGCTRAWARLAKDCGMQYLCLTAKHHDGFCLWDTRQTDYKITALPGGFDLFREFTESCREEGLLAAVYYSLPDWDCPFAENAGGDHQLPTHPNPDAHPDRQAYKDYVKRQIGELLTGYGPIAALFWDIPPKETDESVNAYVRSLAPGILINDRGWDRGDYGTPERCVPDGAFTRLTEACQSVGRQSWGYRRDEDYFSLRLLTHSIDRIMARGGNYLLNIGPRADGSVPAETEQRLRRVGDWYRRVRESYQGAAPIQVPGLPYAVTRQGNAVYIHLPGLDTTGVDLRPIAHLPREARLLNTGLPLKTELAYLPAHYSPAVTGPVPYLHLQGIPVDALENETPVIRLLFDDPDAALHTAAGTQREIL